MPWSRLDRQCSVGPVSLIPFSQDNPPTNLDPHVVQAAKAILADFIAIDGRPVARCVLVSFDDHVFVEGFDTRGGRSPRTNS